MRNLAMAGASKFNNARAKGSDKCVNEVKRNLKTNDRQVDRNTTAYIQILGTGMDTQDTVPSVLLFFDNMRFLFNAGEGLQRFCTEHKVKLSKIDYICFSRVCSETAGGLPGLLLTLAGIGEGMSVKMWGPPNLEELVEAMKSFVPHSAMVNRNRFLHAATPTKRFGLASCSINAAPPATSKFTEPFLVDENGGVKISAILLTPSCLDGSGAKPSETSVIYICELPEIMGKLHVDKATNLGITDKSKYKELKNDRSVKSDLQDIVVHPIDVLDPSVPGPIVFIVDCPTEYHAKELLSLKSLDDYCSDFLCDPPCSTKTVNCIIHLSPASVVSSPTYEKWMQKFDSAQHIMAGNAMKHTEIPILQSSARIVARLNYLCPQLFPSPAFWSLQHYNKPAEGSSASSQGPFSNIDCISAENLLKFTLRPHAHLGLDRSSVPSMMVPSDVINELLSDIPEIVDAAKHVSLLWQMPRETKVTASVKQDAEAMIENQSLLDGGTLPSCLENIRRDDLEIVLLGTGSSQPSKYRNVSSIYINLFSKGSLLLDCGEGTLAQLKRRYGLEGADNALKNLRCIWISHIHADHHAGLARILTLRLKLLKEVHHEPILVIGPRQLGQFLDKYQELEDLDIQFLDCRSTMEASLDVFDGNTKLNKDQFLSACSSGAEDMNSKTTDNNATSSFVGESCLPGSFKRQKLSIPAGNDIALPAIKSLKKVLSEAGLEKLISVPVVHCPESFGVVLKAADRANSVGKLIPGWKFVYSGDSRPCAELIEASCGATILVHEATFEDGMLGEAIARNHSTTQEAIEVGNSAGAYRIILTHFSQRYPKIPAFDEINMQKTCIAFDLMSINIADLPILPRTLPYLKLLFRNEIDNQQTR